MGFLHVQCYNPIILSISNGYSVSQMIYDLFHGRVVQFSGMFEPGLIFASVNGVCFMIRGWGLDTLTGGTQPHITALGDFQTRHPHLAELPPQAGTIHRYTLQRTDIQFFYVITKG